MLKEPAVGMLTAGKSTRAAACEYIVNFATIIYVAVPASELQTSCNHSSPGPQNNNITSLVTFQNKTLCVGKPNQLPHSHCCLYAGILCQFSASTSVSLSRRLRGVTFGAGASGGSIRGAALVN